MEEVQINIYAVLIAAIASLVVSSVWYSRRLFLDRWAELQSNDVTQHGAQPLRQLAISASLSLILSYCLAWLAWVVFRGQMSDHGLSPSYFESAVMAALLGGVIFSASRLLAQDRLSARPLKLTLINCGHEIVIFLVIGLIIGLMGVS